jgi:hypothetical protein
MKLRRICFNPQSNQRIGSSRCAPFLLGAGRLGFGVLLLARPIPATTMIGLDTATATRIVWLSRMAAVRDAALGAGTLRAVFGGADEGAWLLAGALCDTVDAVAIGAAVRAGRLPVRRAGLMATAAAGAGLVGFLSAKAVACHPK